MHMKLVYMVPFPKLYDCYLRQMYVCIIWQVYGDLESIHMIIVMALFSRKFNV
jgi:hypothetical protein